MLRSFYLQLSIVACFTSCCAAARGVDDYPYPAYVNGPQAEVLAGPARKFYKTHDLYAGDEVQVFKRDAAGWLGIRPPEDSFSWIPENVVEGTDDEGVYRVLEETPAWIGTTLETVQEHKYQVKLRPGELVEVIGDKQVKTRAGVEIWLKIAPPAGEFRWIHISQISRSPPREQDLAASYEGSKARSPRTVREWQDSAAAIGTGVARAKQSLATLSTFHKDLPGKIPQQSLSLTDLESAQAAAKEAETIRLADHQQPVTIHRNPGPAGDGFVPRKPRKHENSAGVPAPATELRMTSREQLQNSLQSGSRNPVRAESTKQSDDIAGTFDAAAAGEALRQLDLELSLRVAQPRETWNLEPIRKQVQAFVDQGGTPQERGQARLLLAKIRGFEETFELPNDPLLAARTANASALSPAAPRYDGVGLLQPVLSRDGQNNIAPYAIVDSDGNPVAFVTPGPGMNLRRYENKPVGIYGKRGIIEALRKPHLVAERVIDLSIAR
jgi:hypothetical protein